MYKLFFFFLFFVSQFSYAQNSTFGNLLGDEFLRRKDLIDSNLIINNWMLRSSSKSPEPFFFSLDSVEIKKSVDSFSIYPIYSTFKIDGSRPHVGGEFGMIPSRGFQNFLSTGFQYKISILNIQFQPEFVSSQNLNFSGFPSNLPVDVFGARYSYWNAGDNPERFGKSVYTKFYWGQSNISVQFGAFELGAGTKNYWWGPGQWNSLIFSNNAPGFPNISFNTLKPAKTFLGYFESQILIGKLNSSGEVPIQNTELNTLYFTPLKADWRYLNAFLISYNPKWIPSLSIGFNRTYQYYNSERPKDLKGWLPVLEPLAKDNLFLNGNSGIYDDRKQSQQISIFGRYIAKKAKAEIYFQFGRRDHALNWREFILNPEHARAYQFGFIKLTKIPIGAKLIQFRGEITHQKESVNRYLRYDLNGGLSWHTHSQVRGFTNYGQAMGVGIGTGSNVQTLEISMVEDWKKWGLLFERLENNQDFYYRAFGQQKERKPWIDWSTVFIWNTSYKDLFISARLQGTYARNYQWGISKISTPEFPVSQNLFSLHSQVNVIYFWNRSLKRED
jgi:hypothetical protein